MMNIQAALEIVLELARQNALTDRDDNADEMAETIADQQEAIKIVEDMIGTQEVFGKRPNSEVPQTDSKPGGRLTLAEHAEIEECSICGLHWDACKCGMPDKPHAKPVSQLTDDELYQELTDKS